MGSLLPLTVASHKRRVLNLYKKSVRLLQCYQGVDRLQFRYEAVLMRAKFDKNKDIKDDKVAAKLVADGEEQLFLNQHWQPRQFAMTVGGNAYGREAFTPDWVLDYWHPLEKAQYPEYFARREKRKEEFIQNWIKEYGPLENKHH